MRETTPRGVGSTRRARLASPRRSARGASSRAGSRTYSGTTWDTLTRHQRMAVALTVALGTAILCVIAVISA